MKEETTYVCSVENRYSRAKLNNVIHSLDDFVSCTTNDKTEQEYGTIDYCGPIAIGQVIHGNKRPRRKNVPVVTTSNVFLGYLNENGDIAVENNKQTQCITTNTCTTKSGTLTALNCTSVTNMDYCGEVSNCSCSRTYECNGYHVVEVTNEQCWQHIICRDLGYQYPDKVTCCGQEYGSTSAYFGVSGNNIYGCGRWTGATISCCCCGCANLTMAVADLTAETLTSCNVSMPGTLDSQIKNCMGSYWRISSTNDRLGASLVIDIYRCTVTSFWQKIAEEGCVSMIYV